MKFTVLLLSLLIASIGSAQGSANAFDQFMQRHQQMVNNDGESWIKAELINHKEEMEMHGVAQQKLQDTLWGLEGVHMRNLVSENPKADIVDLLMEESYPFFCSTMEPNLDWSEDLTTCAKNLESLLGDVLSQTRDIKVIEMWGNYYGSWAETALVLQNFKDKQSLVISFDILHEI